MRLARVDRTNFMIPGTHRLDLPERGLVLVVGDNGSGKSSWVDAVGTLWNTTLRDAKSRKARGNLPDVGASVEVRAHDGLRVKRVWSKTGRCGLEWETRDHEDSGTTRSKAQKALDAELGDYLLWRWSCVFSSKSADTFTAATAGQRREILESLLDLELLAQGYRVVHEDAQRAGRDVREGERALEQAEAQQQRLQAALESTEALMTLHPPAAPPAPEQPSPLPEPVPQVYRPSPPPEVPEPIDPPTPPREYYPVEGIEAAEARAADIADKVRALNVQHDELTDQIRALDQREARARAVAEQAVAERTRVDVDQCPTCAQAVDPDHRARFVAAADRAVGYAKQEQQEISAQRVACSVCMDEISDLILAARLDQVAAERAVADRQAEQAAHEREVARYAQEMERHTRDSLVRDQRWSRTLAEHAERERRRTAEIETANRQAVDAYKAHSADALARHERALRAWEDSCAQAQRDYDAQVARLYRMVDDARARVGEAEHVVAEARNSLEQHSARLALAQQGEHVLGPAGPRSTCLGEAMRAVEHRINTILPDLGTPIRVRLVAEGRDIRMDLDGGCGPEYVDLSGGEARRVDLAVLLALGAVAADTRGQAGDGTLWLDEFLDAVDHAGIDPVCAYVSKLAQERCVVVITHREEIIARLRPTRTVVMERGG